MPLADSPRRDEQLPRSRGGTVSWVAAAALLTAWGCTNELATEGRPLSRGGVSLVDGEPADPPDERAWDDEASKPDTPRNPGTPAPPAQTRWKVTLMTGDDSIQAFDNARGAVKQLFVGDGLDPAQVTELSRSARAQVGGVRDASVQNLSMALADHNVGEGDGCIVFMTSHGDPSGFFIRGRTTLSPNELNRMVTEACGDRPTVVLVSACYSGVFIRPLEAPNRIVLTAARPDRTSFGCGVEDMYTYWDACLLETYPTTATWSALYSSLTNCIERKEGRLRVTPSEPQASFGADVAELKLPGR